MALEREKDPLAIDGGVQIKQEINEFDNLEANKKANNNRIAVKKEFNESDFGNASHQLISSGTNNLANVNGSSKKKIKILPFNEEVLSRKKDLGLNNKTAEIKKEKPCNCMQNLEYYCNRCKKTLQHINGVKQCSECSNQLKLQCRLCCKRYKLLRSVHPHSTSANIKKETDIVEDQHFSSFKGNFIASEKRLLDDHAINNNHKDGLSTIPEIKNEGILYCYKCEFSTKVKEQLNIHILKSHWQPKSEIINCDDDMYIELLCKKCQKICRKVVYNDQVKLVCRECQVPMLYRCTLCRNSYKLLKNVRYHVKSNCPYRNNNEKFYCADCTFKTETKIKLENHIIKQHLNQQCPNCHKILEDNEALKEHIFNNCDIDVKQSDVLPVKLELPCNEQSGEDEKFVIIQYRADDLVRNINGKPSKDIKEWGNLVDYLCLECGDEAKKKFARFRPWCRKCNLKYDYRCMSCEKLYGNYGRISYHVKFGCPNRIAFDCPLCKHSASKKSLLFTHIQAAHTIYKCMDCFANLTGTIALQKHQSIDCSKDHQHTAKELEKLIVLYCQRCCKRSRKTINISNCEKCTTVLTYKCLQCLNNFGSQSAAYNHVKKLCKPNFYCTRCSFKTFTQEGLNIHGKFKHMNRMCPDCGICFKDELIFQLHRREEIRRKRSNLGMQKSYISPVKSFTDFIYGSAMSTVLA